MIGWILVAVMVVSDAGSDVLLSRGTKQVAEAPRPKLQGLGIASQALRNPSVLGAGALAATHFGAFLVLLSLWDLSLIIPVGALDYALVTVGARYLLGETVTSMRWAGVGLIVAGVALVSMT